ncbi:phosphoribosylanthranilate isomerase [Hutsoniella sourekii]
MQVKICGLKRLEDVAYCNQAGVDYVGFILDYPKSPRYLRPGQLAPLSSAVRPGIQKVGVFVDPDLATVTDLLKQGLIDIAQLHGQESPDEIRFLQEVTNCPIWKAFGIQGPADVVEAQASPADRVLLDYKQAGSGQSFDWRLIQGIDRPYILAGGLNASKIRQALSQLQPEAIDLSTGVETNGYKDLDKIKEIVRVVKDV